MYTGLQLGLYQQQNLRLVLLLVTFFPFWFVLTCLLTLVCRRATNNYIEVLRY